MMDRAKIRVFCSAMLDVWEQANGETRRRILTGVGTILLLFCVWIMGLSHRFRGEPRHAHFGVSVRQNGDVKTLVVKGRVALLQRKLRARHWNIAIAWGESEENWLNKRRFYVASESMVAAIGGRRSDEMAVELI